MITFLHEPCEVAREVAAAIRADPDSHYQAQWFWHLGGSGITAVELRAALHDPECGTAACVAGWTLAVALPDSAVIWEGREAISWQDEDERTVYFWFVAAAALGISWNSRAHTIPWLFEKQRTRREVLSVLDDIAVGRGYDDEREREGL